MTIRILSTRCITEEDRKKIADIYKESDCVNESLAKSIPDCRLRNDIVLIGDTENTENIFGTSFDI